MQSARLLLLAYLGGLASFFFPFHTMAQFYPAEVGTTVNGFQDDFETAALNPKWQVVGQNAFVTGDGILHATTVAGDPNHLLYELPGYDNSVQEILARVRVTDFGTGDPPRAGLGLAVDPDSGQGINFLFREDPNPGDRHLSFLDDLRAWGPEMTIAWESNRWYWLRFRHQPSSDPSSAEILGKIWLADGTQEEPSTWQLTDAYTSLRPARTGYAGITATSSGGTAEMDVDYVLIKADGLPQIVVAPRAFVQVSAAIAVQPQNQAVDEGAPVTFTVSATGNPAPNCQWLRNGTPIPGETNLNYFIPAAALSVNGASFKMVAQNVVSNITRTVTSASAVLTVRADLSPPRVLSVQALSLSEVQVLFSERVSPATATNLANYALSSNGNPVAMTRATLDNSLTNLTLSTVVLELGVEYTLVINHVADLASAANPITPNSTSRFTPLAFTPAAIGNPQPAGSVTNVPGGLDIVAGGMGSSGKVDEFEFNYQSHTGDFDVKARVAALALAQSWSTAGLVVRESLDPGAAFAGVLTTPSISGTFFQSRPVANAPAIATGSFPPNYPNTWIRLKRSGNSLVGYAGFDGKHWTQLASVALALPNAVYLGFAVSSSSTNRTTTASFREFSEVTEALSADTVDSIEPLGQSSRLTSLVFSEIMYHPPSRSDGKKLEFIELFNTVGTPEDLSGYQLAGDVAYTFPRGTVLPGGGFLVVARSPTDLTSVYGLSGVLGPFNQTNNLPNGSGTIRLRSPVGAIFLEVHYSSDPPWPVAADGAGHSLVLARPSYGEADPRAWATSDAIGGSPGRLDPITPSPLRAVLINEFLAHTDDPELDYVELYNHSNDPVDISGCVLTDDGATNRFVIPGSSVIPPRGFVAFTQTDLGFSLSAAGETIYFKDATGVRVLDAVRFGAQENSVSMGRYPDGAEQFYRLEAQTPGAPNHAIRINDVVINELMYAPISGNPDDQYIELYNRTATAVDLGGWRLEDGVSFTFAPHTTLVGNGYLVVAKNAGRMLTQYTNLTSANTLGDFSGKLSGSGERVALSKPDSITSTNKNGAITTNFIHIAVDEVRYQNGGRWGRWSHAGGSSLERIDPRADGRLAANWADSDETKKAPWTAVSVTGKLDNGSVTADQLQVLLQGSGECLIDDVQVLNAQGANQIGNSTFESDASGWTAEGTEDQSGWDATEGYNSTHCYHIRAVDRGDNEVNRVRTPLSAALAGNSTATIQAKVRWLQGQPSILFRLRGNWLEAVGAMSLPANLGTPGLPNSRALPHAPPAIYSVAYRPILPAANQPVTVTARASDPDGVAAVVLNYRIDPGANYQSVPMTDDGLGADAIAGDGIYSASIPGQPAGTLVAFFVQAADNAAPTPTATFPQNAPTSECLVRFGEVTPAGNLPVYRIWMTRATFNTWTARSKLNNTPLEVTFVLGNQRAVQNTLALYAGSPYIAPGYSTPSGNRCGYSVTFPADDLFLGNTDLVLDWPGGHGSENTALQEQMGYWIANQIGLPYSHRYTIRLHVNGVTDMDRGGVFEAVNQPAGDFVRAWVPDDSAGDFYKIERAFEFSDGGSLISDTEPRLENYTTTGGIKKTARYRWNWLKRSTDAINDYTNIFNLVDAVNAASPEPYTSQTEELVDLEEWMGILAMEHIIVNFDAYGHEIGKNMYAYKPVQGTWQLYMFDLDWLMLAAINHRSDYAPAVAPLFNADDPKIVRMFSHPPFLRAYYRAIKKAVDGPLVSANCDPVMDAKYQSLVANGVLLCDGQTLANPQAVKNWFGQRRAALLTQLDSLAAAFAVTSNQGNEITTNAGVVTLTGTAPIEVKGILVNGQDYPVTWTTVTNWAMRLALSPGQNEFGFQAVDASGALLANETSRIHVTFNGQSESPVGQVLINEIMFQPALPSASFVELYNRSTQTSFDLSGWRLKGVDFTFPDGSIIEPGGYLVLAQERSAFTAAYGNTIPVAGEFAGNLNLNGENLSLVRPGIGANPDMVVNSVTYGVKPPWPSPAAGSSLQLIDPAQDNSRVVNWGTSTTRIDPSGSSQWQYVTATGTASTSRLYIYLTSPGDVYIDDLRLVAGTTDAMGPNLLPDGDFESGFPGPWTVSPNLAGSVLDSGIMHSGHSSLHVVSTSAGTSQGTAIWQDMGPLATNAPYTLSYWYLPSTNGSALTIRLSGSGINSSQNIAPSETPPLFSTPGHVNSIRATLPALPALWINELEPNNLTGSKDEAGEHNPWVEIYNAGNVDIRLDGWSLADQYTNLTQWSFPSGITLGPRQFLLVWLDGAAASTIPGNLHANFRIAPTSGSLALVFPFGSQSAVLDYMDYNVLSADRSIGLFPDGQFGPVQTFFFPTPGSTNNNNAPPLPLFINEWMAENSSTIVNPVTGHFDDWFELFNPNAIAIDLTGYMLADSLTNSGARWPIPAGTHIVPKDFLLIWADGTSNQTGGTGNALHAPFKLSKAGEAIGLFAPNGSLVDSVTYSVQTNDVSQGRWPDGGATFIFMSDPTPGSPNLNPDVPPEIQIVEVGFNAGSLVMSWRAAAGQTYRIQAKVEIDSPSWTDLNDIVAIGLTASSRIPVGGGLHRFFRVQLVSPSPIP